MNWQIFEDNPIIAAVKTKEDIQAAIQAPIKIVFLLDVDLSHIRAYIEELKLHDKYVFVHMDLVKGLAADSYGLEYIVENTNLDGIITTSSSLVKKARSIRLPVIQRFFMIDSLSIKQGIKSINENKPDAVEVLPGLLEKQIQELSNNINIPVIAGGFIESKEDVFTCLKSGALSISTSKKEVWNLE